MNKKSIKITTKILLCALFAVLDYYISLLLAKTHFKPLFLDTLFEMTASFAFGPLYGILSVLFKPILNIIMVPDFSRWPGYLYSFYTTFIPFFIALGISKIPLFSNKDDSEESEEVQA